VTRVTLICVAVFVVAACAGDTEPTTTTASPVPSTTVAETTASTGPDDEAASCRRGAPRGGFDLEYERFLADYQFSRAESIVELIGDGPVYDPWLDPRVTVDTPISSRG